MNRIVSSFINSLKLLAVIISVISICILFSSMADNQYPLSSTLITLLTYMFLAVMIYMLSKKFRVLQLLVISFILGLILRIIWIYIINPLPISDYYHYYSFMLDVKGQEYITSFPAQTFFWTLMGVILRFFPFVEPGTATQIILAFLQASTGIIIGKALLPLNRRIAITVAYLWAFYPADIFFSGVLTTDIPQAFCTALLLLAISRWYITGKNKYLLFTGIVLIFVALIRKAGLFMIPAIALIPLLKVITERTIDISQLLRKYATLLTGALGGFIIAFFIAILASGLFPPPKGYWWGESTMYPLLSGTNYKHYGGWNIEDSELYFSLPRNERDKIVIDTALQRLINIYTSPSKAFSFSIAKLRRFLSDYGFYWSVTATYKHLLSNNIKENIKEGFSFSDSNISAIQAVHKEHQYLFLTIELGGKLVVFFLALLGIIWIIRTKHTQHLIFIHLYALILITYIISHMAFEAQGRYHHMLLPFIFAVAGWALCWIDKCKTGN